MRVYTLRDSIRKRNLEEAGMTGKPRKGVISFFPCEVTQNLLAVIHADRKESWNRKSAVQALNLHFDPRQRDVDTGNQVRMERPLFALINRLAKNPPSRRSGT